MGVLFLDMFILSCFLDFILGVPSGLRTIALLLRSGYAPLVIHSALTHKPSHRQRSHWLSPALVTIPHTRDSYSTWKAQ